MTIKKKVVLSLILLGLIGGGITSVSSFQSKDLAIDRNTTFLHIHHKDNQKYFA
ncbi:hypothetical protein [Bacillus inaquosorum]|uniref:hypothetical protein n=1 Tax=Bacillus inaquosorum TaxID=483913 RepID=UPI002280A87B|nr:hypothetical protein [Bacillus inaquosorum]MCY8070735.1 hypothetical protein [Bacillus inaquosorum]MCY9379413.1 hypothetical protein [Bacillus inaquosorum]